MNEMNKDRSTAAWLAILLGSLGLHQFYLGHARSGVIRVCASVFGLMLAGLPLLVMEIIGIVEGVKYLKMSDEAFRTTYVVGGKEWL